MDVRHISQVYAQCVVSEFPYELTHGFEIGERLDVTETPISVETKYIFVTGGVVSSLGKGIISSSLACLLKARGLRVTIQKFDPYISRCKKKPQFHN